MKDDTVFKVKGIDTSEYRVNLQAELDKRLKNRRIMEVFLIQVRHPWYTFQTLLRLDDGTVVEIPHLSGALHPACIEHIRYRKTLRHHLRFAETDEEKEFWKRALEKKKG